MLFSVFSNAPKQVRVIAGPFAGAKLYLCPRSSKRKIFGVYEHVLNSWLDKVLPEIEVVWDVGANDGYFTYGAAHRILKHKSTATIVAFEPGLHAADSVLRRAAAFPGYSQARFDFVPKLVSHSSTDTTVTLSQAVGERPDLRNGPSLVKVDVEGAELEVLAGAGCLIEEPTQWVVEVHGKNLLQPVLDVFSTAGRKTKVIQPQAHWLLGPEQRTLHTCRVVTI